MTTPKTCGALRDRGPGSRPRRVGCQKPVGHERRHFATWGGAQRWCQIDWSDEPDRFDTDAERRAYAAGSADERARVVADLRTEAAAGSALPAAYADDQPVWYVALRNAARRFERGEHLDD